MPLLILLLGFLPAGNVKNRLLTWCGRGWRIHPTARIQPCLLLRVGTLQLGPGSGIGFGTVLRDLSGVILEAEGTLGQLNWVTGGGRRIAPGPTTGTLTVGERATVTSRHYLDCAGGITLGRYTFVSGVRTTILTHGANARTAMMELGPVSIGDYTLVGSGVMIVMGADIADRCVIGAGSVVPRPLTKARVFYAGNPAVERGPLTDSAVFDRTTKHALDSVEP